MKILRTLAVFLALLILSGIPAWANPFDQFCVGKDGAVRIDQSGNILFTPTTDTTGTGAVNWTGTFTITGNINQSGAFIPSSIKLGDGQNFTFGTDNDATVQWDNANARLAITGTAIRLVGAATVTGNLTCSANISGVYGTFSNALSAASGSFTGALAAASGNFTNTLIANAAIITNNLGAGSGTFIGDVYANNVGVMGDANISGDITAAGGFRTAYAWAQENCTGTQTSVDLFRPGISSPYAVMERVGSLMGFAVAGSAAINAGTVTFVVTKNGANIGYSVLLGAGNQYFSSPLTKDQYTFTAGDRIGVQITTTDTLDPQTIDWVVDVIVEK